jgi:hypothetical protein
VRVACWVREGFEGYAFQCRLAWSGERKREARHLPERVCRGEGRTQFLKGWSAKLVFQHVGPGRKCRNSYGGYATENIASIDTTPAFHLDDTDGCVAFAV